MRPVTTAPEDFPGGERRGDGPQARSGRAVILGCLLLAGVLLRLLGWGNWSLWLDETMQVDYSLRPKTEILKTVLWDGAHPPLSYLVTGLVARVSLADAALRLPSVLFGMSAVALIFFASGGFRRFRPALGAAALLTFLPVSVHYGQEIRPYALALFFLALLEAARRRSGKASGPGPAILQVGAATGALYTLYFAAFPVAAAFLADLAAALRVRRAEPGRLRRALLIPALAFVLYLPWLIALWREPRRVPEMPAPRVTARLVLSYAIGLATDRQESWARPGVAAFVWLVALLGLAAARGRRADLCLQLLACFAAPLIFLLAIRHWWILRYVVLTVLPLSAAFGEGTALLAGRAGRGGGWLLAGLIALVAVGEAPGIVENVRSAREDWRRPAAYLAWQFRQGRGGAVVAADGWTWWCLGFQTRRLKPPIDIDLIADNLPVLRAVMAEKGSGWIFRTPHHPVPPDLDRLLAQVRPWGVFAEAEDSRLYRFEKGRLVPP